MATMGRMAMPFYILYAGQTMDLTGQTLGVITFAFTISATVSNLIWGFIADRKGFRAAYLLSILLWVLSTILLMFADGLVATVVVFVGIGAASQGFRVASMMLTLEFGSRDDLPIRIAIANTASEIAGTLGPLSGGIIAAIWGYESVFILSITFLLIGGTIVKLFVPEPRHAKISFGD
jgi:MFS family permease